MQEEAIFTMTSTQLMVYITVINAIFVVLMMVVGFICYRVVNARITRLNIRIGDAQSKIADRSIVLAQSLSELAQSLSNARRHPSQDKPASSTADRVDDVVVLLTPDKRA